MAGVALVIGALAVTATLAVGCAAAGAASVRAVRLAAVADAAALAAADAATGAIGGAPCPRAADVAAWAGASVEDCVVDGVVATVVVGAAVGPFRARAVARAGPAP
ncbi:helicase [Microbacterium sp. PA5]|uniref:helicase n=1 Tax=Microbacterium sp. PA5 TaxID=3416654 RepID=UPI003CF0BC54